MASPFHCPPHCVHLAKPVPHDETSRCPQLAVQAFADVGDGIGVAMKLFGNVGIGNFSIFCLIDGKEDVGVFNFLGVALAGGDELEECASLFGGQGDFVEFLHGNFLVRENGNTRERIQVPAKQGKKEIHKIRTDEILFPCPSYIA